MLLWLIVAKCINRLSWVFVLGLSQDSHFIADVVQIHMFRRWSVAFRKLKIFHYATATSLITSCWALVLSSQSWCEVLTPHLIWHQWVSRQACWSS